MTTESAAACACLRVYYKPLVFADKVEERWLCSECGSEFRRGSEARSLDLNVGLRHLVSELRQRLVKAQDFSSLVAHLGGCGQHASALGGRPAHPLLAHRAVKRRLYTPRGIYPTG